MRLVCPNCDAQYEVDASAVPEAGRDVQCSNCGHTWFQMPPDVEAELEADQALYGRLKEQVPQTASRAVAAPAPAPAVSAPEVPPARMSPKRVQAEAARSREPPARTAGTAATTAATTAGPADVPAVRRGLDESLLAVLREEAERETAVRRAETPRPLETQSDLGLEDTSAAGQSARTVRDRLARIRGDEAEPEVSRQPTARRDLLPDIEEINSTLRASTEHRERRASVRPEAQTPPQRSSNGFRSGFSLMLLLSVMALFTYVAAPRISEQIPALKAPLEAYVTQINKVRIWGDGILQQAITGLQGMSGPAGN